MASDRILVGIRSAAFSSPSKGQPQKPRVNQIIGDDIDRVLDMRCCWRIGTSRNSAEG